MLFPWRSEEHHALAALSPDNTISSMMKLFKKSAVELAGYNPYSELVFGGWDYNIANMQSAILKSKSLLKVGTISVVVFHLSYLLCSKTSHF